jgi:hypothetical protein
LFIRDKVRSEAAIRSAYAEMDSALADAARLLDPSTLVLVISDHGFQPADAAIREDPADLTEGATAWHRPYGIAAVSTAGALAGTAIPLVRSLGAVTPLDIVPSLLAYAGLPVARDMPAHHYVLRRRGAGSGMDRLLRRVTSRPTAWPAGRSERRRAERLRALGYVTGASATSLARVNLVNSVSPRRCARRRAGSSRAARRSIERARLAVAADPTRRSAGPMTLSCLRPPDPIRGPFRWPPNRSIVFLAATDLDISESTAAAAGAWRACESRSRLPRC